MLLLAIDIGNTHTVIGVFHEASLIAEWRLTTSDRQTADELALQLKAILREHSVDLKSVGRVGISSVVPPLTDTYARMVRKATSLQPVIVDGSLDLGIRILYDDPMAVGADRLCNAIAGFAKYGGPLIIVDFGTATTYDIVASNGDYLGGVIAPGVETSAADLHRRAARLPKIELQLPPTVIATHTVASMQAGVLYGAIDATEGMVRRLQEALRKREGKDPSVIATGGFSAFIAGQTSAIGFVEPSLVLDGIRLICEKVLPPS